MGASWYFTVSSPYCDTSNRTYYIERLSIYNEESAWIIGHKGSHAFTPHLPDDPGLVTVP